MISGAQHFEPNTSDRFLVAPGLELIVVPEDGSVVASSSADDYPLAVTTKPPRHPFDDDNNLNNNKNRNSHVDTPRKTFRTPVHYAWVNIQGSTDERRQHQPAQPQQYLSLVNFTGKIVIHHFPSNNNNDDDDNRMTPTSPTRPKARQPPVPAPTTVPDRQSSDAKTTTAGEKHHSSTLLSKEPSETPLFLTSSEDPSFVAEEEPTPLANAAHLNRMWNYDNTAAAPEERVSVATQKDATIRSHQSGAAAAPVVTQRQQQRPEKLKEEQHSQSTRTISSDSQSSSLARNFSSSSSSSSSSPLSAMAHAYLNHLRNTETEEEEEEEEEEDNELQAGTERTNESVALLGKRGGLQEHHQHSQRSRLVATDSIYSLSSIRELPEDEEDVDGIKPRTLPRGGSRNFGDIVRRMMHVSSIKHGIPESVRDRRSLERRSQQQRGGTELHRLCMKHDVSFEEVLQCLLTDPKHAEVKDYRGALPLHLVADNDELLRTTRGRETAGMIVERLLQAHPFGAIEPDNTGMFPFFRMLSDWVDWAGANAMVSSREGIFQLGSAASESIHYPRPVKFEPPRFMQMDSISLHRHRHHHLGRRVVMFPRVEVWEEVEWCLNMLAVVLSALKNGKEELVRGGKLSTHHMTAETKSVHAYFAKSLVAKIPCLLQAILLIDDDGHKTRTKFLQFPVVQLLLITPETVSPWIVDMLHHGGVPAARAIDYFWLVSGTTIDDYTGGLRAPTDEEQREFEQAKQKVMDSIESLEGSMASIVTLKTSEIERAASSPVIWYVMNKTLSRPFVFGLVNLDIVLHFVLMMSFRFGVSRNAHTGVVAEGKPVPTFIIQVIAMQYLIRKACEIVVYANFSTSVLVALVTDLWFLLDLFTIIAVMVAVAQVHNTEKVLHGLNATVMGFLWIKVLSFLKVVNQDLSTFITSVIIILGDIKYFTIVMIAFILMFGDMYFLSISERDGGGFCASNPEGDALSDFCDSGPASYLRVYSILLGDIEVSELTSTASMQVLFLLFTFFGVIVLLNVLIAVVSDSFEDSKLRSALIFSRSRAYFVAKNQALEALLSPNSTKRLAGSLLLGHAVRWTVLIATLGTALFAEIYLLREGLKAAKAAVPGISAVFTIGFLLLLSFLMAVALWIVISFIADEIARSVGRRLGLISSVDGMQGHCTAILATVLFGLDRKDNTSTKDREWQERALELEQMVNRVVSHAKQDILDNMRA